MKRISKWISLFLIMALSLKAANNKVLIRMSTNRIAVVSDLHVMAPELLEMEGKAFDSYVAGDRKMLKESTSILQELTRQLLEIKPELVLISGDLTKDGEFSSHRYLVENCLNILKSAGIRTLVVPGNHDVNNPNAVSYNRDTTQRVKTVTPKEFADCYSDFGYGKAIARDPNSLSYVAEPCQNLRILAIDACRYEMNDFEKNKCVTGGRIKPETMDFIRKQVADAKIRGIQIFAMMHHGLIQHWNGQSELMKDYLIEDWSNHAESFSQMGLNVIFTGHFHAQDIVKFESGNAFVYDIETGSTVTYPCPYRLVSLNNENLSIETRYIRSIDYDLKGVAFQDYAKKYLVDGLTNVATQMLPDEIPDSIKTDLSGILATTMIAHSSGDEQLSSDAKTRADNLFYALDKIQPFYAEFLKQSFYGIWQDYFPADNRLVINLNNLMTEENTEGTDSKPFPTRSVR